MNSPDPANIIKTRKEAGLTQTEAAALIHCSMRAWQKWEAGERTMHPAFWDLFLIKLAR
jgi:DNA (cytosine-5)-methyltransferase 1